MTLLFISNLRCFSPDLQQRCVIRFLKSAAEAFFTLSAALFYQVLVNNAQASASGVTLADHTTEQFDLAVYSGLYATFPARP